MTSLPQIKIQLVANTFAYTTQVEEIELGLFNASNTFAVFKEIWIIKKKIQQVLCKYKKILQP